MMATQDYAPGPYVSFATSARDGVETSAPCWRGSKSQGVGRNQLRGDSGARTATQSSEISVPAQQPCARPLWRSVLSKPSAIPHSASPGRSVEGMAQRERRKARRQKDEIEWSGITDFDLQQGKVSREQVQQYLCAEWREGY